MKSNLPLAVLAILSLSACSQSPADDPAPEPEQNTAQPSAVPPAGTAASSEPSLAANHDAWAGRWIGVEGLFVDIQPTGNGTYKLEMQSDLDTVGTYTGTSTAEGIAFERGGETLTLRQSNGAQTGLKWLDGKQDCLMVKEFEGFCRD